MSENSSEIFQALSLRHAADDRICVCCAKVDQRGHVGMDEQHFVTGVQAATDYIAGINGNHVAIWTQLHRLRPDAEERSADTITKYVNLAIDIDRRNNKDPQGCKWNSTDAEKAVLLEMGVKRIVPFLKERFGLAEITDSGNGYHLRYTLEPLEPKIGKQLYSAILQILGRKFESPEINMRVDLSMSNETRVLTVPGTWNRKYPNTEERPQRQCRMLESSKQVPISVIQLELFCGEHETAVPTRSSSRGEFPPLHEDCDPNEVIAHYEDQGAFQITGESSWKGMPVRVTSICLNAGVKHTGSVLTGFIVGDTLGYHCFSDDCTGVTIGDVLKKLNEEYEPYVGQIWLEKEPDWAAIVSADDLMPELTTTSELISPEDARNEGVEHWLNEDKSAGFTTVRTDNVHDRAVDWLWKGRLPRGCGLIVSGGVGTNKSMLSTDFAAKVSNGWDWPDDEKNEMGPREVLIAATEDDLETTIVPRLKAAGADLSKIHYLKNSFAKDEHGTYRSRELNINEDIFKLRDYLKAHPKILLVILDPLTGFFGDVDGNDNKKIRPMMQAIARVCQQTGVAFILLIHENKRSDASAVDKILGAGAVSQVIRAGIRISKDPNNKPDGRKFANIKGNLSRDNGGMKFSVGSKNVTAHDGKVLQEIGYIEWGEKHAQNADDVMEEERAAKKEGGEDTKLGQAVKIFEEALIGGKRLQRDVHRMLDAAGISDATKRRAKAKLGVVSSKSAPWYWWLPGMEPKEGIYVEDAVMGDVEVM
jgi:putative DNA primase/helicase